MAMTRWQWGASLSVSSYHTQPAFDRHKSITRRTVPGRTTTKRVDAEKWSSKNSYARNEKPKLLQFAYHLGPSTPSQIALGLWLLGTYMLLLIPIHPNAVKFSMPYVTYSYLHNLCINDFSSFSRLKKLLTDKIYVIFDIDTLVSFTKFNYRYYY